MRTYLTGEHDKVLILSGNAPTLIDQQENLVLPPKHITELDRVCFLVHTIED